MPHGQAEDELFGRLRRLAAEARTSRHRDRRVLLSLQHDIRAIRAALTEKRDAVSERLKASGQRISAITAYARTASIARGLTPARMNKSNGVKS